MKTIKLLTAVILIVMLFASTIYAEEWYVGGTLHKATIQEWRRASYRNRLATCADFIVSTSEGKKIAMAKGLDAIKFRAMGLERCISEASEGAQSMNMKVTEVAAMCIILIRHQ